MFTKIRINLLIIVLFSFIIVGYVPAKAQRNYSIDQKQKTNKIKKTCFLKRWFMGGEERAIRKQERKDDRKNEKLREKYLKEMKKQPKRLNNNREAVNKKKVYKRMKRERKKSEQLRKKNRY